MKNVLTIAGSDPSGGAGIQADLMTFHAMGVRGVTVITAITAQNEKRFFSLNPVSSRLLREQLQAITSSDTIDAMKIGLLGTEENVNAVYRFIETSKIPFVVLDPIFRSSTGAILLDPKGVAILKDFLLPLVTLVTPNLSEAETLTKMRIKTVDEMKDAAAHIHAHAKGLKAVLIKGGHLEDEATDVLYDGQEWTLFPSRFKVAQSVHGTGCVLSAAIVASLAQGLSLKDSVQRAKEFITSYIRSHINSQR